MLFSHWHSRIFLGTFSEGDWLLSAWSHTAPLCRAYSLQH